MLKCTTIHLLLFQLHLKFTEKGRKGGIPVDVIKAYRGVKIKSALEQAVKANSGSRDIGYSFFNLSAR